MPSPTFQQDELGGADDQVSLVLGGKEILIAKSYEVKTSVFTQPCAFALQFGWGDTAKDLLALAPPQTSFELRIGGITQFTGLTDGRSASGSATGGTTIQVRGRDGLAKLYDGECVADKTFSDVTYRDLVVAVLFETIGDFVLVEGNGANRKAVSGYTSSSKVVIDEATDAAGLAAKTEITKTANKLQVKAGEKWHAFLMREFNRSGLFLWQGANSEFILATVNTDQAPLYRFIRRHAQSRGNVNVKEFSFDDDTAHRFSECVVLGRGGDSKSGTKRAKASYADAEMAAYGVNRPHVVSDPHCDNKSRADHLAHRTIAETRRSSWKLEYTIAGHSAPTVDGGRAIVVRDTMAQVTDEELGIDMALYVGDVVYKRHPQTETTVTLYRPEDLVFGGES